MLALPLAGGLVFPVDSAGSSLISPQAKPYRLAQEDGRWWFFGPDGKRFWSLGVCCTKASDSDLPWGISIAHSPEYLAWKQFSSPKAWVEDTLARLKRYGFNSIGAWSDTELFQQNGGTKRLPYFEVLHLGAFDHAPWSDMFRDDHRKMIESAAQFQTKKLKDDPYMVGYFTDNELGWWREVLFINYLALNKDAPGHKKLIETLRAHYKDDFSKLKKDWTTDKTSFDDLDVAMKLRSGGDGMSAVKAWQSVLTKHYYAEVRDAIRRYDKDRPILGDRYSQFYYTNVVAAAAPYVDAISANYGSDWNDGGTTEYFLSTLYKVSKKPVLVSEFYSTAMENRSGNKNSSGGFPVVQTQKERAKAVAAYLKDLARRPYVVGAHWFQFFDEPTRGRADDENYNMGLVDVEGKPYEELLGAFRGFKVGAVSAPAFKGLSPMAPKNAKEGLKVWPRAEALIKPGPEPAFADLYVMADKDSFWVGLHAMTFTDESLYPNNKIPEADRAQLKFTLNGKTHWVRFGGKDRPCTTDSGSKLVFWKDGVRCELGLKVARAGARKATISGVLTSHGRGDVMGWGK